MSLLDHHKGEKFMSLKEKELPGLLSRNLMRLFSGGQQINANFSGQSFSRTLRVMDVRAKIVDVCTKKCVCVCFLWPWWWGEAFWPLGIRVSAGNSDQKMFMFVLFFLPWCSTDPRGTKKPVNTKHKNIFLTLLAGQSSQGRTPPVPGRNGAKWRFYCAIKHKTASLSQGRSRFVPGTKGRVPFVPGTVPFCPQHRPALNFMFIGSFLLRIQGVRDGVF